MKDHVRPNLIRIIVALWVVANSHAASAENLSDLVAREAGTEFGPCSLQPRPAIARQVIHVVIPARFDSPGDWTTRTILLVGLDSSGIVQGVAELRLADPVPPREVLTVRCSGNRLAIQASDRVPKRAWLYEWNGKKLQPARALRK